MNKFFTKLWPIYLSIICIAILVISLGDRVVYVIADAMPVPVEHVIVIDAGHGGEDGGATSCTGKLESELNLEIALRLDSLCHLLGMHTTMIRTTDVSVYTEGSTLAAKKASDLRNRVRIVNAIPDAILISIHQNTFSDNRYSGAQVFFADTPGSKELAAKMQKGFASVDTLSRRKEKQASGVYLMQNIEKTGVLVECGFLSNQAEEAKLRNTDYQKKLCSIIASVINEHINA